MSHRKNTGANIRIHLGCREDGVVDGKEAFQRRLFFEARVSFLEASETAMDRSDGSDVLPPYAVDVNGCRRFGAVAPLLEDDVSKMASWN
ncbi:hypothetical protein V3C99_002307 [Haemonchus contortus]|uniref:Uncharacterized protein n=1 Tax=Haemonchus contortus TaxID=6289 RepID=A0A7I4YB89_HAECO